MLSIPAVSVCLTMYNRAHLLPKTLESIAAQTFTDFEVVMQDDASSDDTERVCREWEKRDRRFRYFRNERNLGMPGNLNAGIARCQGTFIANLHDGDIFSADLLMKWKDALERHPDAAFVFNALNTLEANGTLRLWVVESFPEVMARKQLTAYMLERFDSPVWGTVMARRNAYERHGLFNERYSFISDVEMWMRLNLYHPVVYLKQPLITLTPHEADRPYAFVNWRLERAMVSMHEETIEKFFDYEPIAVARARRRLRKRRDRRWLRSVAACIKRGRFDLVREGASVFRSEDVILRVTGALLAPFFLLGKSS